MDADLSHHVSALLLIRMMRTMLYQTLLPLTKTKKKNPKAATENKKKKFIYQYFGENKVKYESGVSIGVMGVFEVC